MTKRILRGVQDIKTISGRAEGGATTYKAFMKLSILEMEKFRRGKERQNALDKVTQIDQRFQEIEAERQEILATLEDQGIRRQRLPDLKEYLPATAPKSSTGSFKIRY